MPYAPGIQDISGQLLAHTGQILANAAELLLQLRRLCRAIGGTALVRVGAPMPDELGFADAVAVQELSSRLVTVFRGEEAESAVSTLVLRGATMNVLDDMERSIDDAVKLAIGYADTVSGVVCIQHGNCNDERDGLDLELSDEINDAIKHCFAV
jgi:chaperonin GroEL (HSP60 family)